MLKCFRDLIKQTIETYVDDIVVKSKKADQLMADIDQTFMKLRANDIKLNPEKCVFRVPRVMLLRFIVSERGIEANPEKISAITRMGLIHNLKGYSGSQGASQRLAILSRTSMNKAYPFIGF
jgi:hypothetical protein